MVAMEKADKNSIPSERPPGVWCTGNGVTAEQEQTQKEDVIVTSGTPSTAGVPTHMKVVLSTNSILAWVALGMFLEVAGPTLPYLRDAVAANTEEIARVLVARSVGYLLGALAGGVLLDKFPGYCYLLFSLGYLLAAIGTITPPWSPNLEVMGAMFFLQGLCQGSTCTGSDAVQIRLWGDKAGPPLIAQHFGFGVGALIVPQLANAFVHNLPPPLHNGTANETTSLPLTTEITDTTYADLQYSYGIIGGITGIFVLTFFFAHLYVRKHAKDFGAMGVGQRRTAKEERRQGRSIAEILSPGTCAGGDTFYGAAMFLLMFLLYIDVVGGERIISKYLYTYAFEGDMGLTATQATNLNSLFWLAFVCGRGINIVIARFVSIHIICFVLVGGNLVNSIVLASLGNSNEVIVWVFSASFGLFLSPLFPSTIVWADVYVEMTAVAVAVAHFGAAVGGIIFQYLGGYLFEEHGPHTLWYIIMGYAVTLVVIFIPLQLVAWKHGPRRSKGDIGKEIWKDESVSQTAMEQTVDGQLNNTTFIATKL